MDKEWEEWKGWEKEERRMDRVESFVVGERKIRKKKKVDSVYIILSHLLYSSGSQAVIIPLLFSSAT